MENSAKILQKWLGASAIITNCYFSPIDIENFLVENSHKLIRCYWKNLAIPGINTANLDGTNVGPTEDAQRYDDLGDKNYITIILHDENMTITLSSAGAVGFISKVDYKDKMNFLRRKIFPIL